MGFVFEKCLGKADPFVTEFTWKFLPGLGHREGARTPPRAGQCCCFAAVWYFLGLLGGALIGCCSTAISSGTKLSWGSFFSFSSCALLPSWPCIPALQLDIPLASQFFVWHLCALHYGTSLSWEHRVFLPLLCGGSHQQEICVLLGPRQEPGMKLEDKAATKAEDEVNIKHWMSYSTPPNILWNIYALKPPSTAFPRCTGCFLPVLQWGGPQQCCEVVPTSEGTMCTYRSRQSPGIPPDPGWDALSSPTPSTEREHSQEACKQSGPVMSSQLIDYWKYNWILCLGEI